MGNYLVKTTWICYASEANAEREAKELSGLRKKQKRKTKISIEQRGKGEALNKFRTTKGSRYVKTDKRYCVVER